MRIKLGIIFCVLITLISLPSSLLAQEVSPTVKKDVVKNFKANLNTYSPFGSSGNCSLKNRGDANCDGVINQFDLSVWEVEFNIKNSPLRSDFNSDGVVNLLDFGVWRSTFFPQKSASLLDRLSKLLTLSFQWKLESKQFVAWILDQVQNDRLIGMTVIAQELQAKPIEVQSSIPFTSNSGNSQIFNSSSNGNSQQVSFNQSGNATSSQLFSPTGQQLAGVSYLESGTTIISTQQDGVQVQISKASGGAIIQSFASPDGSLLAIKSWPTQESYDKGEPPLSVTVPGQGNIRNVLNIQPNGDSILEKTDTVGNVLSRNQIRANGTLVTEDLQNKTLVQSNSQIGFTSLTLDNNLGGKAIYMFYQGQLYAVIQTNSKGETYIAKPLTPNGDSWSFESNINGQTTTTTVANPITELKSNTPDPAELIRYINYYKDIAANPNNINFTDAFPTTAKSLNPQIQKANQILTISNGQAPAVLGIVQEAFAADSPFHPAPVNDAKDGTMHGTDVPGWSTGTITGAFEANRTNQQPVGASYSMTVSQDPDGTLHSETTIRDATTGANATQVGVVPSSWVQNGTVVGFSSYEQMMSYYSGATVPFQGDNIPNRTSEVTQPTTAAPPPAVQPAPVTAPVTQPANQGSSEITPGMTKAAGEAADKASGGPAEKAGAAFGAAIGAGANADQASRLASDSYMVAAIRDKTGNSEYAGSGNLYQTAQRVGLDPDKTVADGMRAINAQREAIGAAPITTPSSLPSFSSGGLSNPSGSNAAPTAAAAVAAGIPAVGAHMTFGNGMTSTITSHTAGGGFTSSITDSQGHVVATQVSDPATGRSDWTAFDAAGHTTGTYTANSGSLTAMTSDVSAAGSIVGISATDHSSLVSVGSNSYVDANGFIVGGREATLEERAAFDAQQIEQGGSTGAGQYGSNGLTSVGSHLNSGTGTCFLAATKISTPFGFQLIETLKPGNKVYSYNEKTGTKEVSDFKGLDVNFVDEYLIINGKVRTTIYHPFYILQGKYASSASIVLAKTHGGELKTVRADGLKLGDILLDESNNHVPVSSIEKVSAPKTTVYNLLNVSKNNNFFAEGILVHNYADGSEFDSASLSNEITDTSSPTADTTATDSVTDTSTTGTNDQPSDTGSSDNGNSSTEGSSNNDPGSSGNSDGW